MSRYVTNRTQLNEDEGLWKSWVRDQKKSQDYLVTSDAEAHTKTEHLDYVAFLFRIRWTDLPPGSWEGEEIKYSDGGKEYRQGTTLDSNTADE